MYRAPHTAIFRRRNTGKIEISVTLKFHAHSLSLSLVLLLISLLLLHSTLFVIHIHKQNFLHHKLKSYILLDTILNTILVISAYNEPFNVRNNYFTKPRLKQLTKTIYILEGTKYLFRDCKITLRKCNYTARYKIIGHQPL